MNNTTIQRVKNLVSSKSTPIPLDTLAQLRTPDRNCSLSENYNDLKTSVKTLKKRARSKYISNGIVLKLVDQDSDLEQSYWNTWHCSSILNQEGNKLTSKYCGNRWCIVCNRIRTAKNIKQYEKPLQSLINKQFVTLTIPNVKEHELSNTIDLMQDEFKRIQEVFRKRRRTPIVGIKKLECTYNYIKNDYHPHYHIIVEGKEVADELKKEWLNRFPLAKGIGQDVRECNDNSIRELFKYFTKVLTKTDKGSFIHGKSLDIIFRAMKGRRVFQSMGIKCNTEEELTEEELKELESQEYNDLEDGNNIYEWNQNFHDWINLDTGEVLTGYIPTDKVKDLVTIKT